MERWVEETLHRGFRARLRADKVLFDSKTELQHLIIFDLPQDFLRRALREVQIEKDQIGTRSIVVGRALVKVL